MMMTVQTCGMMVVQTYRMMMRVVQTCGMMMVVQT